MTDINPTDFPKLESPYERETVDGEYVVQPEIQSGYDWVFNDTDNVRAVEKLHGCFSYRSKVDTDSGDIKIGKIVNQKLDVNVLSYNFNKDILEYKPITDYHKRKCNKDWLEFKVSLPNRGGNERSFILTTDHKIFVDGEFIRADEVSTGDNIYSKNKHSFSELKKQILIGSILCDGHISKQSHSNPTLTVSHGENQYNYLEFKANLFGNLVKSFSNLGKGGFPGSGERKSFRLSSQPDMIQFLYNYCSDKDNKKTITKGLCDKINPLALAIWYLDDGHGKNINKKSTNERIQFATNSFNEEECKYISEALERFNLKNRVVDYGDGNRIEINVESTRNFYNLIWPYVPNCMDYKMPDRYKLTNCILKGNIPDEDDDQISNYGYIKDITKPDDYESLSYMFDLSVKSNHNYFVGGTLVHNSNVSIVVKNRQVKEAWTRIGEETINKVRPYSPQHERIAEGIAKAQRKGWLDGYKDGQHFGEIIGEKFHNNPYDIDGHLFVPFDYLYDKVHFKSYGRYPTDFESISGWFKELTPLFYSRIHDMSFSQAEEEGFIEGIVFTHEDGRQAKLRKDMLPWYEGKRHKQ